jgi:hypothetical protein
VKIKEFIQTQILLPRLQQHGVLVVYDPERRYHELCLELASEKRRVIDASESSITSRLDGLKALQEFGQPNPALEGILIYAPAKAPLSDEEKQRDPFALYGVCGAVFPEGDGDEYQSLCLKARADYAAEIRRIFNQNPNPSFAVIDAVGGGAGWPTLQAALRVESARDILFALLAPSETQALGLKNQPAWAGECAPLFQNALGLSLKTKLKSWEAIAGELWRFLLFSEFVFDLPVDLPSALRDVPKAPREARHLVEDLCEQLRNDRRTQSAYIERAEAIQGDLNLPAICREIEDLGVRDTFPFEERSFFSQAVEALRRDNPDQLRQILERRRFSVWGGRGENQVQWGLVQAAASLVQACEDAGRQLGEHTRSLEALLDHYTASLREADRLQREFEQAVGNALGAEGGAQGVIQPARTAYRKLAEKVQQHFMHLVERSGWPLVGRLANGDVFDKLVAPRLKESGHKVALFLIDAMRYELGVELARQLNEAGQVDVQAACAQLPTVTPVGMASLLPGAGQTLTLLRKDGQLAAALGDQTLVTVTQRMDVLRKRYGQRFAEIKLEKFGYETPKIDRAVELLVVRSNEMDNEFESNPEAAPGLVSRTFQRIRSALQKLAAQGFREALIVTDHGFFLNMALEAGDVCAKPPGNWINVHERILLGDGAGDAANLVLEAGALGLRGDFNQAACPKALVAYSAGQVYFHGGLSLQEALVPVISIRLRSPEKKTGPLFTVNLSYKRGAKKITTRLPVVEISLAGQSSLFSSEGATELVLEAHDLNGEVVGEARPGGPVNPATLIIAIKPGETLQAPLMMDSQFEGHFLVKALDPNTQAALGKALELETDYTV